MIRLAAVTLKQLRSLAAISEHGSITAAAEALGLTPPAVHAQSKSLEAMVPEPVLQRVTDSAGSRLTGAGEVLRDGIERIEMPLNGAIKQAVMAWISIAFLSLHTVSEEIRSRRTALLPARDLPVLRDWHLFWPEDRALKPVAAHLRDAIISLHRAFLPQYDVGRPVN